MKNKLPTLLTTMGAIIALLSISADLIGLGQNGGVPAVQILGAQIGVLIALLGIGISIYRRNESSIETRLADGWAKKLLDQPTVTWVLIGFLIAYILFYIFPTFLNDQNQFRYSNGYLPPREHIGFDTRLTLEHIRVWFSGEREAKYIFPALTTILLTPLLLLRYPADFYVITTVTLLSYLLLNLFLPLWIRRRQNQGMILLVFVVSIFSYGMQFELETGQFYTIAMACTAAAIYIFHRHPNYRIFAYILFSISIQLKLFPAIFIVMFVDDWRDWKTWIKRFISLGLANFALLFLLGYSYFSLFISHLVDSGATDELDNNHSIYAFVTNLAASGGLETFLYGYFFLCFGLILVKAYWQNEKGIHLSLWMACLIGGLTIPAISHDYTLPLLTAPLALIFSAQNVRNVTWIKIVSILLIVAASFSYSATLFPPTSRPLVLENTFPFLWIILTAVTALSFMQAPANVETQQDIQL